MMWDPGRRGASRLRPCGWRGENQRSTPSGAASLLEAAPTSYDRPAGSMPRCRLVDEGPAPGRPTIANRPAFEAPAAVRRTAAGRGGPAPPVARARAGHLARPDGPEDSALQLSAMWPSISIARPTGPGPGPPPYLEHHGPIRGSSSRPLPVCGVEARSTEEPSPCCGLPGRPSQVSRVVGLAGPVGPEEQRRWIVCAVSDGSGRGAVERRPSSPYLITRTVDRELRATGEGAWGNSQRSYEFCGADPLT